jgi:hypothetical protein
MLCQFLYESSSSSFFIECFVCPLKVERKEEKIGGRSGKYCLISLMILPYSYMSLIEE